MKQRVNVPYYEVKVNIKDQIRSGSSRRGINSITFILRKLINFTLARLAFNCPFNSWRVRFHRWRGVKIGNNVLIGLHVILDYSFPEYITIEDNASLSGNNYILTHSIPKHHFKNALPSFVAPVTIKKGAWVGIGVTIMPDVTIGEYSVIATCSLVNKNIPSKVIAGGVPAKILKQINLEGTRLI